MTMAVALQIARMVAVIAMLGVAAAIATPKGRLPLALRGVAKLFRISDDERKVPWWKRLVALALVVLATILAAI